jgi:hypothetical protein
VSILQRMNTSTIGGLDTDVLPPGTMTVNSQNQLQLHGIDTIHLGNGNNLGVADGNVGLAAGAGNAVVITADDGAQTWTFGADGTTTFPTNGHIGATKGGTMLDGGNGYNVSLTSFYSSGLYSSCVTANPNGTLNITAYNDGGPDPAEVWTFDNYGGLTFPQGTRLGTADGSGAFIIDGVGDKDILIYTYSNASAHGWTFGSDGKLTLPEFGFINSQPGGTAYASVNSENFAQIAWTSDLGTFDPENGNLVYNWAYAQIDGVNIQTYSDGVYNHAWRFSTDGQLQLAENGGLSFTNGTINTADGGLTARAYNGPFTITVDEQAPPTGPTISWTFAAGGDLTLPVSTVINDEAHVDQVGYTSTLTMDFHGDTPGQDGIAIRYIPTQWFTDNSWFDASCIVYFANGGVGSGVLDFDPTGNSDSGFIELNSPFTLSSSDTWPITITTSDYVAPVNAGMMITNGGHTWKFDENGNMTLPSGSDGQITLNTDVTIYSGELDLISKVGTDADTYSVVEQTNNIAQTYLENTVGANTAYAWTKHDLTNVNTPTFFIELSKQSDGVHHRWTFDTDNTLNLPNGSGITDTPNGLYIRPNHTDQPGVSMLSQDFNNWVTVTNDQVQIETDHSNNKYQWDFDKNGNLFAPGDIKLKSTAAAFKRPDGTRAAYVDELPRDIADLTDNSHLLASSIDISTINIDGGGAGASFVIHALAAADGGGSGSRFGRASTIYDGGAGAGTTQFSNILDGGGAR